MARIEKPLLWLFIVNLGIVLGAGIYESRLVFPLWLVELPSGVREWRPEVAREMNVGLRFWAFVSTGPTTLLALASLIVSLRQRGSLRKFWVAAALVALAERAFTFAYFIPNMLILMERDLPEVEALRLAEQWAALNYVRHALTLAALLLLLSIFSKFHEKLAQTRSSRGEL